MGQRRNTNHSSPSTNPVSEQQIRLTQGEIADQSGELPELDLHGLIANQASFETYNYILSMDAAGEPCCRIVHGKGTGVLQSVVTKEINDLTSKGIIDSSFPSRQYPGAAIVVVFRV